MHRRAARSVAAGGGALLVALLAAGCGSGGSNTARQVDPPRKIDPLTLAPAYASVSPTRSKDLDHPYTTGRIVVVDTGRDEHDRDVGDGRFDAVVPMDLERQGHGDLLAERAGFGSREHVTNPEEVGTIVWISCTAAFTGNYSRGGAAYRTDCTATIIDATRNLVVGETTSSLDPPKDVMCSVGETCPSHYGGFDHEGFSRYLAAQPRRDFTAPVVPA